MTVCGHNVLVEHRVTMVGVLLRQLRNPLLILLGAAAVVSAATGDPTDAIIIGLILALSVGLGFTNEYRAERAAIALHPGIRRRATVWRDGDRATVDVADLVAGDVVELAVGVIVPADLRLLETTRLECDEAVLTGESATATKASAAVAVGTSPAELAWCAVMGTIVHQGTATAVVVETGARTEFGKIAAGLGPTSDQHGIAGRSEELLETARRSCSRFDDLPSRR